MKLTTTNLNQFIREEITKNLQEGFFDKFKSKKKIGAPSKPHPKGDVFFDAFRDIIDKLDRYYGAPPEDKQEKHDFPADLRNELESMLRDGEVEPREFANDIWLQGAPYVAHHVIQYAFMPIARQDLDASEKTLEKTTHRFKNFLAQNSKYRELSMLKAVLEGEKTEHKGIAQQARNIRKQDHWRTGGVKPTKQSEMPTMDIHPKK